MRKTLIAGVAGISVLAGCAQNPNQASNDYLDDPKYNSQQCTEMRQKALEYNDRVGARMGTGLALGLFLGPFGIPLAMGMDKSQDEERKAWGREIHLACSSDPLPDSLK